MSVSTEGLIWLFAGFAVEMTRRGNRGKVKSRTFPRFPQRLETRTKRGFPHSPSDGGCEYYKGQCSQPLESRGFTDSRAEPKKGDGSGRAREPNSRRCTRIGGGCKASTARVYCD